MTNLDNILSCINGKHIYIQTHNFPDPDAIASAFGLQKLLESKNISSVICYKGKIDRSSTNKMVNSLGIKIVNIDDIDNMKAEDEIILVDAQKGNANIIDTIGNEIICIDHHPTYENINYVFSDIRPEVGACVSIIAEYFWDNDIYMDKSTATALMYGLKVDTANMTRGVADIDLETFYKLYRMCDLSLINELNSSTIQFDDLHAYATAINSIKIYDNISFSNTGMNCPEALIATISDFVLELEEINFSVVYSIKDDGIKLSIRSDGKYDAGKVANEALKGIGNGGGHERMAGGFVPFCDCDKQDSKVNLIIADLEQRFIETLGNDS